MRLKYRCKMQIVINFLNFLLRSTLGLIVRFLPEIKLDLHNRQKYSYTIEVSYSRHTVPTVSLLFTMLIFMNSL